MEEIKINMCFCANFDGNKGEKVFKSVSKNTQRLILCADILKSWFNVGEARNIDVIISDKPTKYSYKFNFSGNSLNIVTSKGDIQYVATYFEADMYIEKNIGKIIKKDLYVRIEY